MKRRPLSQVALVTMTCLLASCQTSRRAAGAGSDVQSAGGTEANLRARDVIRDESGNHTLRSHGTADMLRDLFDPNDSGISQACYVGSPATACKILERLFDNLHQNFITGIGEADGELLSCVAASDSLTYSAQLDVRDDPEPVRTNKMVPCQSSDSDRTSQDQAERKAYRRAINKLAAKSRVRPLQCINETLASINSGSVSLAGEEVKYVLKTKAQPPYRDAFVIEFTRPGQGLDFSTLVAYEGSNGFRMGDLKVESTGSGSKYTSTFGGFMTEQIEATVNGQGMVDRLIYESKNPQHITIHRVACQ